MNYTNNVRLAGPEGSQALKASIAMTNSAGLVINYRPPSTLKPDKGNPRAHPKKQVAQIAASIREFGLVNPILVDDEDLIIAGHGRLLAAKQLGLATVPTIRIAGLTPAQKKALRIADNRIAQNASWDLDLLRTHIVDMRALEIDLDPTVTGFSIAEIDVLLSPPAKKHIDEPAPAVASTARAKPGDIWRVGRHQIGCGDARDLEFVRKVVGQKDADAVFTDPPYNVSIQGHANVRSLHREFAMASGEMSDGEFVSFLKEALGAAASVSKDGAVHFVCMDWRHMAHLTQAGDAVYDTLLNVCVWNKSNAGMGSLYRSKHELVFVYRAGSSQHYNAVELGRHGRNRTNVWDYPSVNTGGARAADLDWHPTVKPTAMVADAIRDVTRPGEVVLDPFLGSGATLIATEQTDRQCRGVEIDPAYVDIAIERWEAVTGEEARRLTPPSTGWTTTL